MANTLEELREALYEDFNDARKKARDVMQYGGYSYFDKGAQMMTAAAEIASAIAAIDQRVEAAEDRKNAGLKGLK